MNENIRALLVPARPEACEALRLAMEQQSIEVCTANNCFEVALILRSQSPPHLVFTDIQLPDGDWRDVLSLAASASAPVNVIVVAPKVDVALYIQTMEGGAFDFIVSSTSAPDLLRVVRAAVANAFSRRRRAPAADDHKLSCAPSVGL